MRLARMLSATVGVSIMSFGVVQTIMAQEPDQVPISALANATPRFSAAPFKPKVPDAASVKASGIPGIDTLVNFTGSFTAPGFDPFGNFNETWYYAMVGRSPDNHGPTILNAPIIPVSLDLTNFDGSPRYVNGQRLFSDATQYVQPVLNSPIFSYSRYTSSEAPTQFADAIQRAEFFKGPEDDWHTLLVPKVKTPRVMTLIEGTYQFALNSDGSCCAFVLIDSNTFINLLFPPTFPVDNSTVMGAAELAGDITTADLSTFLFPNAFLYTGTPDNCCTLGFHMFDFEPGIPANGNRPRFYVMNYSSWITPVAFLGGVLSDVVILSHEMAETFNDPFLAFDGVHGVTPWWLAPNGQCQDLLEGGDAIENLPNSLFPITLNGFTYQTQNIMLLPWFEFQSPSQAIDHAYSYPNTNVVNALSPQLLTPGCQ